MAWRPPPRASLAGDAFFKKAVPSAGGSATASSKTRQRGALPQSPSGANGGGVAAAATADATTAFARYAQLCRKAALGGRGQKHAVAKETRAMVARLRAAEGGGGGGGDGAAASASSFVVAPAAAAEALEAQLRLRGDVRGLAPLLVRRLLARTQLPPGEVASTARFVRAAARLSHAGATVPLVERALEAAVAAAAAAATAASGAADTVQLAACLAGTEWKAAVSPEVSARLGRRAAASLERADARVWDGCRFDPKALADAAAATTEVEEDARLGAWAGRAAAGTPFFAAPAGLFARQLRPELRRGGADQAAALSQLRGAKRLAVAVAASSGGDGGEGGAATAAALCLRVLLAVRVAGAAAAETKGAGDLAAAALRVLVGMLEAVRSSKPAVGASSSSSVESGDELPAAFGLALRGVAAGLSARRPEALAFLGGGVGSGGELAASNTELRARRAAAEAVVADVAALLRRVRMPWPGAALGAEALAGGVLMPVLPLLAAGAADDGAAEEGAGGRGEETLLAVLKVLPRVIECFPTRCTAAVAAFATSLPQGVAVRHAAACLRLHEALGGDPSRVAPEAAQAWMRRLSPLRSGGASAGAAAAPRDAARQEELRLWVAAASAEEAVEAAAAFSGHLEASGGEGGEREEEKEGFGRDTDAAARFLARVVPAAFDALAQVSPAAAAAAAARRLLAAVRRVLERGGRGGPLLLDPYPLWASLGDARLWRGEGDAAAAAAADADAAAAAAAATQVALLEHGGCFSLSVPPSAGGSGQRSPLDKMLRAWANGVSPPATSLDCRAARVLARALHGRGAEAARAAGAEAAEGAGGGGSLVKPEALWALLQGLDALEMLEEAWEPSGLDSLMRRAAAAAAAAAATSVETAVALMRAATATLHAVVPTPYVAVERAVDAAADALLGALDAGTLVLRTTAAGGAAARHIVALRAALAARGLEDGVVSELSWHCCAADAVALRLAAAAAVGEPHAQQQGRTSRGQAVATETAIFRILETYQAYEAHRRVGGGRPAVTRMLREALAEAAHTHAAVFVDLCLRYFPLLLPGGRSAGSEDDDDDPFAGAPPALELPLFLVPAGLAGRGRPVLLPLSLPGSVVPASADVSVFSSDLVMEAAKEIPV